MRLGTLEYPVKSGAKPGGRFRRLGGYCKCLEIIGRGERIRTSDPLVPNQKPVFYLVVPLRLVLRRFACYSLVFGSQWTQIGPKFLASVSSCECTGGPVSNYPGTYLAHTQNQLKLRFELADATLCRKETVSAQLPDCRRSARNPTATSTHRALYGQNEKHS
jgi:hypothetical protein